MRRFSLYKRGKYFYVQFLNEETGKYLSGKSTGCTNRNEAVARVLNWVEEPTHRIGRDPHESNNLIESPSTRRITECLMWELGE